MRQFLRKREQSTTSASVPVDGWPVDSLEDIDDDAFARAIAAGREAEKHQLVA
jgi:hypothetical protein